LDLAQDLDVVLSYIQMTLVSYNDPQRDDEQALGRTELA
jgi:hypothetical protein